MNGLYIKTSFSVPGKFEHSAEYFNCILSPGRVPLPLHQSN